MGDGAYNKNELIQMEVMIFKAINYDMSMPLSYTFLRRYAKVSLIPEQSINVFIVFEKKSH